MNRSYMQEQEQLERRHHQERVSQEQSQSQELKEERRHLQEREELEKRHRQERVSQEQRQSQELKEEERRHLQEREELEKRHRQERVSQEQRQSQELKKLNFDGMWVWVPTNPFRQSNLRDDDLARHRLSAENGHCDRDAITDILEAGSLDLTWWPDMR